MTQPEKSYTREQLRAVAYMSAGAGAQAVLMANPHAEMPSDDISVGVEAILAHFFPGAERKEGARMLIPEREHASDCHCNRCIGAPLGMPSEPVRWAEQ